MQDYVVGQNKYGLYSVPTELGHRPAVKKVLSGNVYEPLTIEFLIKHVGHGDIVHAGTFFGDFLPALSKHLAAGATVWAFEPNPASFRHAQRTIELNKLANVVLTNAALSSGKGEAKLRTRSRDGQMLGGGSKVVGKAGQSEDDITINTVSLDVAVPHDRHISVLQLDVEGHEKPALAGAAQLINRCRPILVLEMLVKNAWLTDWLGEMFPELGYAVSGTLHSNVVYVPSAIAPEH